MLNSEGQHFSCYISLLLTIRLFLQDIADNYIIFLSKVVWDNQEQLNGTKTSRVPNSRWKFDLT
jgi:hypothetical protein